MERMTDLESAGGGIFLKDFSACLRVRSTRDDSSWTGQIKRRIIGGDKLRYAMCVPSKANIGKLDNPARLKINHQAETEPGV